MAIIYLQPPEYGILPEQEQVVQILLQLATKVDREDEAAGTKEKPVQQAARAILLVEMTEKETEDKVVLLE